MDHSDKRQQPRYDVRIFGVYKDNINIDETEMMMGNLSLGGAFIYCEQPPAPGTPVTLRFEFPGSDIKISVIGVVIWRILQGHGAKPGMGVKFEKIKEDELVVIKRFIESLVEEDLFGK